jgi:predicted MFS family arabinose efflux permease
MIDVYDLLGHTAFAPTARERSARSLTPSPSRLLTPLTLLVLANAVSLSGNVITTVAIPWLVLTTTGSATLTGVAVFAGVGGAAVGGLAAGRIVDAIGPIRTSSAADLLSGLAVAPLPILLALDALEIWHVVVLAIVGTLADSAGSTARQSLVPAAADSGGYTRERANAVFTSAEHTGYLLGAPVAGLLIAAFGVGAALWVTVGSFAIAALVVARLVDLPRPSAVAATAGRAGLRETIAFIWGDPALRALLVFPTVAVLLVGPLAPIVLPVLAREAFGDPVVLGLMVASYGAGGLLGAAGFGIFGSRIPGRRLFAGVFVVWPATYAAITLVQFLPFTLAMLLTLGAAAGSLVPLMATIRQQRTPGRLLPRVVGISMASVPVAAPIGVLATGFLIDGLGLHQTLLLMTAGAALIGTTVLMSEGIRALDDPDGPSPVIGPVDDWVPQRLVTATGPHPLPR